MTWPSAARAHAGQQAQGQAHGSEVVDGHRALVVVGTIGGVCDRAANAAPGIVDQGIDHHSVILQLAQQSVDVFGRAEIRRVGARAAPAAWISASSARRRSAERATRIVVAPACASLSASARPMPLLAPVISTQRSASCGERGAPRPARAESGRAHRPATGQRELEGDIAPRAELPGQALGQTRHRQAGVFHDARAYRKGDASDAYASQSPFEAERPRSPSAGVSGQTRACGHVPGTVPAVVPARLSDGRRAIVRAWRATRPWMRTTSWSAARGRRRRCPGSC